MSLLVGVVTDATVDKSVSLFVFVILIRYLFIQVYGGIKVCIERSIYIKINVFIKQVSHAITFGC